MTNSGLFHFRQVHGVIYKCTTRPFTYYLCTATSKDIELCKEHLRLDTIILKTTCTFKKKQNHNKKIKIIFSTQSLLITFKMTHNKF